MLPKASLVSLTVGCFSMFACSSQTLLDAGMKDATIQDAASDNVTSLDAGIQDSPSADGDLDVKEAGCNGPTGLLAWWKGENNLADEMGNVPLTGSPGYANAEVGKGFDLTNSGLEGSASALNNLKEITIEGWILMRTPNRVILTRRYNDAYQLEVTTYITFAVSCNSVPHTGSSTGQVPMNKLTHIAVTYDSTLKSQAIKFYIDGQPSGMSGISPGCGSIPNDMAKIYIGTIYTGGAPYYDGLIDELSVYNRVLAPNEIASVYANGTKGKCK